MRNKGMWVLVTAIALAATLAGFLIWKTFNPHRGTSQFSPELRFHQEIAITRNAMKIDGNAPQPIPCDEPGTRVNLGTITLDSSTQAELTCIAEYMQGISLHVLGNQVEIAMTDGDAGERWESRSWIRRTEEGKIQILTASVSSVSDGTGSGVESCTSRLELQQWDPFAQDFRKLESPKDFDFKTLEPPIDVQKECLDEKGRWKGDYLAN